MVSRFRIPNFPHISRFISADAVVQAITAAGVVAIFGCGIVSVAMYAQRVPSGSQPGIGILRRPYDPSGYIATAMFIDPSFTSERATYYARLAADITGSSVPSVLGASTSYRNTVLKWQDDQAAAQRQLAGWVAVTARYPEYADGFIRAGYYALMLNRYEDAQRLLDRAVTLSPFSQTAFELRARIPRNIR
jgi:hypothetical protein